MPEGRGYLGVDLLLGPADDGSQDYVIEVNPRLTTSYVGLRALSETNVARAMLDVAAGRAPVLAFRDEVIEFDADGTIRPSPPAPFPAARGEGSPTGAEGAAVQ
jgi:predicted ATP-grasp superfamily ATP-dependent carboligase